MLFTVITTIQEPTECVVKLARCLSETDSRLIIIGDRKGPTTYDLDIAKLLTLDDQKLLGFQLEQMLPVDHYARKNIGYLQAIRAGAECIYETDDDNQPNGNWHIRSETTGASSVSNNGWFNVYSLFSNELIWPRGFPLALIRSEQANGLATSLTTKEARAPIQQGLADNAPDVDAIWRLVLDRPFIFENRPSIVLAPGTWCPFNSQNTWWWPSVFPLLYLPSFCSFRMTDIWRGFVAQRCLWELGFGLVFHSADVIQKRNDHNLMKDFQMEIEGYEQNEGIINTLTRLSLQTGEVAVSDNLRACYEALVAEGIFPSEELQLLDAWVSDLKI